MQPVPVVSKIYEKIIQRQFHILITIYRRFFVDLYKGIHHKMLFYPWLKNGKKMIDNHGYPGAVLMDLSKAFDTKSWLTKS